MMVNREAKGAWAQLKSIKMLVIAGCTSERSLHVAQGERTRVSLGEVCVINEPDNLEARSCVDSTRQSREAQHKGALVFV